LPLLHLYSCRTAASAQPSWHRDWRLAIAFEIIMVSFAVACNSSPSGEGTGSRSSKFRRSRACLSHATRLRAARVRAPDCLSLDGGRSSLCSRCPGSPLAPWRTQYDFSVATLWQRRGWITGRVQINVVSTTEWRKWKEMADEM
jgi:hypothetical protein